MDGTISKYKEFGLSTNVVGQMYFESSLVREMYDPAIGTLITESSDAAFPKDSIDLIATYSNEKLMGLKKITQEEYDVRTLERIKAVQDYWIKQQNTIVENSSQPVTSISSINANFSGVSVTGGGPIGIELVKTSANTVSFEMLGVEDISVVTTSSNVKNGIMEIKVTSTGNNPTASLAGTDTNGNPAYMNVVRVYIPNISFSHFDILSTGVSNYLYVRMEDFMIPTGINIDIKNRNRVQ